MQASRDASSAFTRAFLDLLSGARSAHDMARALAGEAVRTTLARVAADYPLDYTRLLQRYEQDVVAECCGTFQKPPDAPNTMCTATTKTGRPCGRRAAVNGVCTAHLDTWREQQEASRRQGAYVTAVGRERPRDVHTQQLREQARKRKADMSFPEDVAGALRRVTSERPFS